MSNRIPSIIVAVLIGLGSLAEAQDVKRRSDSEQRPPQSQRPRSTDVQQGKSPSGSIRYRDRGRPSSPLVPSPDRRVAKPDDGATPRRGVAPGAEAGDRRSRVPHADGRQPATGSIRHHRDHDSYRYDKPGGEVRSVRTVHYPRFGTTRVELPATHRVIYHRSRTYYVSDGIFYAPVKSRYGVYRVVRPPVGVSVSVLPFGYAEVWIGGRLYFRYADVYYTERVIGSAVEYVVVEPPVGAVIVDLPPRYRVIERHNRRYFVVGGFAYEPIVQAGVTCYRRAAVDVDVDVNLDDDEFELDVEIDRDD